MYFVKGMDHARALNSSEGPGKKRVMKAVGGEGQVSRACQREIDPAGKTRGATRQALSQRLAGYINADDGSGPLGILPGQPPVAATDLQNALARAPAAYPADTSSRALRCHCVSPSRHRHFSTCYHASRCQGEAACQAQAQSPSRLTKFRWKSSRRRQHIQPGTTLPPARWQSSAFDTVSRRYDLIVASRSMTQVEYVAGRHGAVD